MAAIRYRTGMDRRTGRLISGWAHAAQSLETIWTTRLRQRAMRLDFGSNLFGWLGRDLTPATALGIYRDLVEAAARYEPEYRLKELQLVRVTRIGGLGLRHKGTYFPEGRFGNFAIAQEVGATAAFRRLADVARAAA